MLGAAGTRYTPYTAAYCEQCAACKQQQTTTSPLGKGKMSLACKRACKKCPDVVVLGGESKFAIQVGGVTAVEYVLTQPAAAGQGRALHDPTPKPSETITTINYGETRYTGSLQVCVWHCPGSIEGRNRTDFVHYPGPVVFGEPDQTAPQGSARRVDRVRLASKSRACAEPACRNRQL